MYVQIHAVSDSPFKKEESRGKTTRFRSRDRKFSFEPPPDWFPSESNKFLKLEAQMTDWHGTGERGGEIIEIQRLLTLWLSEEELQELLHAAKTHGMRLTRRSTATRRKRRAG